jgi:hypothetical protein
VLRKPIDDEQASKASAQAKLLKAFTFMVKARKRKWEIEAQGGFELGFFAGQEMEHEAFELGP